MDGSAKQDGSPGLRPRTVTVSVGAEPAAPAAAAPDETPAGGWSTLLDLLIKLVPAAAGALGVVGFVGAIGAALTWWRYWTAGLPANQALKAVPLDERLITGAGALIAFLVLGVVATAVIYTIDEPGRPTGPMRQGLGALVTAEVLVAIWVMTALVQGEDRTGAIGASIVMLAWGAAGWVMTYDPAEIAGNGERDTPYYLRRRTSVMRVVRNVLTFPLRLVVAPIAVVSDQLHAGRPHEQRILERLRQPDFRRRVGERFAGLCPVSAEAERLELTQDETRRWARGRAAYAEPVDQPAFRRYDPERATDADVIRWRPEQPFRWLRRISWFGYLCGALASAGTAVLLRLATGDWVVSAAFVAALGLAALVFGVCRSTRSFWPYGVAIVLSVALFGTFTEAALLAYEPQAQPVAVVRADGTGAVAGLYVADTDDGVWLSPIAPQQSASCDPTPEHGSASIVLVERDDVEHRAIGGTKDLCDAVREAPVLRDELLRVFAVPGA